ncbi:molybdopterin-dependent oxidoreductase, partial [Streptomyces sp. NPDC058960]|uniref:molybdopterin-dependent oxidoreductase n=1 Tax=Streptomyces sp. NPDC058960 TaxID=3346679 RepID=UPI0036CDB040
MGSDGNPGSYEDIDLCDTLLLVGHNVAETQTVLWACMLDRLHGPDPPRLVVIDPRSTSTAREADAHVPLRPGTNVAVLNGILHELIRKEFVDHRFVAEHTVGFKELADVVAPYTPEHAGAICGVPADVSREA